MPAPRGRSRSILLGLLAAGLILRVGLCDIATRHGYKWDHVTNIRFGLTALEKGLLRIYSVGPSDLASVPMMQQRDGAAERIVPPARSAVMPNYPPLCMLFFSAQVGALRAIDPQTTANTFAARLVMSSLPTLFDLLAALGLYRIVRRFAERRAGVAAAAAVWLAPPVLMNAALWGQVDSFFLAPAVLAVDAMLARRWALAGLFAAAAALLKPQGLLMAPILFYAALTLERGSSGRRALLRATGAGAAASALLTLPWMLESGAAWMQRCYIVSFLDAFPDTTLKAFNIWYLDALRLDGRVAVALDSRATLLGASKDAWGRALILASMAAFAFLARRSAGRRPIGVVLFAMFWLWSAFMLPTRVHERYIIYAIPFAVAAAGRFRRFLPVVAALFLIGAAEHSWNIWLDGPAAGTLVNGRELSRRIAAAGAGEREEVVAAAMRSAESRRDGYLARRRAVAPMEWGLTLLSLGAYLYGVGACVRIRRDPSSEESRIASRTR